MTRLTEYEVEQICDEIVDLADEKADSEWNTFYMDMNLGYKKEIYAEIKFCARIEGAKQYPATEDEPAYAEGGELAYDNVEIILSDMNDEDARFDISHIRRLVADTLNIETKKVMVE